MIKRFTHIHSGSYGSAVLLLTALLYSFCGAGCKSKENAFNSYALNAQRKELIEKYPKMPHDEILQQIAGNHLYTELEERYRKTLSALKAATDSDHVKMVVLIMTPDVGKFNTLSNTNGIPFITGVCTQMGIECVNLSADIAAKEEQGPDQYPEEGTWAKNGAAALATFIEPVVARYGDYRNSYQFPAKKPATLGDLPPKDDEIIDGDKNQQYRLVVNAQGLRMDHNLSFPKTKQTMLFLGGTQLYSPFLDNNFIATILLQKKFPDKEIVNAGNTAYTLDDFLSLYREKARFTEPDVVFVCTNGDDILNFFFSQRNRFSRSQQKFDPSEVEQQFYEQTYINTSQE